MVPLHLCIFSIITLLVPMTYRFIDSKSIFRALDSFESRYFFVVMYKCHMIMLIRNMVFVGVKEMAKWFAAFTQKNLRLDNAAPFIEQTLVCFQKSIPLSHFNSLPSGDTINRSSMAQHSNCSNKQRNAFIWMACSRKIILSGNPVSDFPRGYLKTAPDSAKKIIMKKHK